MEVPTVEVLRGNCRFLVVVAVKAQLDPLTRKLA